MSAQHTPGPFMHTFPANPVRAAYTALAVRHGFNVYPLLTYEGRECYVTGSQRIRPNVKGRGYFNSLSVHFLDGTHQCIPAGKFNKSARAAIAKAEGRAAPPPEAGERVPT